ncbi:vanillate O-demethylase ferredoxin subunit [Paraburkholderia eburnea]|uniref:Vanillate O-demethylase ferredoxin subunit n=1 Tax=Paraburkholderia eburnea TaxID=1189126 RepID=A0A2S4M7F9_9BURK|nr:PDR/VanB family oxidoreductase [Paraburkholderia eburnea]POR50601.1 vanillate O-demethylase ferredoxin subunit [Paraburkholderia eburnea]PRZ21369.1 vanillate O-demethylase ferredoxin subunit [Paraburkholderia eburnea]
MKVTLTRKLAVATDICVFELANGDGSPLPAFAAGAHIDVHVGGFVRQYSLCNRPSDGAAYRIGVLRDPASRGGSTAMHALSAGTSLEISTPKNHFPLDEDAQHTILLAGGIGITPLMAMAEQLNEAGRPFELHYCAREPERAAFRERLAEPGFAERTHFYFDSEGPAARIDLERVLAQPRDGAHVYVCGPAGFIDAVLAAAARTGWPAQNVHREYFSAAQPPANADANTAANTAANGAFQVTLASCQRVIDVPAGTTIVEALRAGGIEVPVSCEQGVCGTCLTRVLAGEPDHRDLYLTDEERAANDQLLPCCSRARTPMLVLDL